MEGYTSPEHMTFDVGKCETVTAWAMSRAPYEWTLGSYALLTKDALDREECVRMPSSFQVLAADRSRFLCGGYSALTGPRIKASR